jgi:uncharacterized heparinase superfamily protein
VSPSKVIETAGRTIAFARYMPMAKLVRRAELTVRRQIRDRFGASDPGVQAQRPTVATVTRPAPIFAPRDHLAPAATANGLRFTFLHRSVDMANSDIDWMAPGPGAHDQLWRMNLHYMEFLEGLHDAAWSHQVTSWIDSNGWPRRGAWKDGWNSYALSLRVVVWLQELVRRDGKLEADVVARCEASAVAQIRFLVHNLETDLGGNHLIKNIKALIWASAYFSGPEAVRWRQLGLQHLARQLPRQILSDGMHDERSASYHAQVFADLLECRHALGTDPLGGQLDSTLTAMAQVVADLAHPDRKPVQFNDAGRNMAYAPDDCLDAYFRLTGVRPQQRSVFALMAAGYFGLRSRQTYFVADCGRIAPDDLPAHGHGDVLAFEWSVAGQRIIVDQGVYEYVAGEKRQHSRSAANHNTLSLAGTDQADFFGAFRCGRRPHVSVRHYDAQDDGFTLEGMHDGFTHLPGQPRHVRRFAVTPDEIVIRDHLEGETDRFARIGFLLHPTVSIKTLADQIVLRYGTIQIVVMASEPVTVETAVWWPDMGLSKPTHRLIITVPPGNSALASPRHIETRLTVVHPRADWQGDGQS